MTILHNHGRTNYTVNPLRGVLHLIFLVLLVGSCGENPTGPEGESHAKLVFVVHDTTVGLPGLYTMNLDGSDLTAVAVDGDTVAFPGHWGDDYVIGKTSGPSIVQLPRWSPDGEKILCQLMWAFEGYVIMIMDADGSNKHVLYEVRAAAQRPKWSPEGDKILFLRTGALGGVIGIGMVDASGENDHDFQIAGEVPNTPVIFNSDSIWFYSYAAHDFQWGPTGSQIYATGLVNERPDPTQPLFSTPAMEIFNLNSGSGAISARLTNNTIGEARFRLSPNGRYFAIKSGKYGGPNSIFVHALEDGAIIVISVDNTVNSNWNWSSDSKSIVFAKDENPDPYKNEDLYLYVVNIEQPDKLTKLTSFMALEPDLYIPKE